MVENKGPSFQPTRVIQVWPRLDFLRPRSPRALTCVFTTYPGCEVLGGRLATLKVCSLLTRWGGGAV